jgi:hypothetical protein
MILALPWVVRRRWMLFAAGTAVFVLLGMWLSSYFEFHYHSPAAPLTLILATLALRRLSLWRRGRGGILVCAVILFTILNTGREWIVFARTPPRLLEHWASSRQNVNEALVSKGGLHVVFVRYGPQHNPHMEVVYNGADVDGSKVVWVRALDADQNAQVLTHYKDRTAWLMTIDDDMGLGKMSPWPR